MILKLLLSIVWVWCGFESIAQSDSNKVATHSLILGIILQPTFIDKGYSYSTISSYAVQVSSAKSKCYFTVRFGFPNINTEIKADFDNAYKIKGVYIQPGLTYYFKHPKKGKECFYIAFLGYFSNTRHQLEFPVVDNVWGVNKIQKFDGTENLIGASVEYGALFSIYKSLQLNTGLSLGAAEIWQNPFPQLNYNYYIPYIPGLGVRAGLAFGVRFGLNYIF